MEAVRIKLSALWIALMLTYLLGDVLLIFSGDYVAGEVGGAVAGQILYLGLAAIMLLPIAMVFLCLVLPAALNRWANIVLAILLLSFNAAGLPTYSSVFDQFLVVVGLACNVATVVYAWRWFRQSADKDA
jgi:hypothetical protein